MGATRRKAEFTIEEGLLDEVNSRIPAGRRSVFVERALRMALEMERREAVAQEIRDAELVDAGIEDSTEIIRRMRDEFMRNASGKSD